jgi:hypothetical protein
MQLNGKWNKSFPPYAQYGKNFARREFFSYDFHANAEGILNYFFYSEPKSKWDELDYPFRKSYWREIFNFFVNLSMKRFTLDHGGDRGGDIDFF